MISRFLNEQRRSIRSRQCRECVRKLIAMCDSRGTLRKATSTINTTVARSDRLLELLSRTNSSVRRCSLHACREHVKLRTGGHPSRHQTRRRDSLFTRYRNFIPSPPIAAAAPPYEPSPCLLARIRYACIPRVGFSSTFSHSQMHLLTVSFYRMPVKIYSDHQ